MSSFNARERAEYYADVCMHAISFIACQLLLQNAQNRSKVFINTWNQAGTGKTDSDKHTQRHWDSMTAGFDHSPS